MKGIGTKFRLAAFGLCTAMAGSFASCKKTPHYHTPDNPVIVADDTATVDSTYLFEFQQVAARQDSLENVPLIYGQYLKWLAQLNSLRDSSLLEQARGVSLAVNNRITYSHDIDEYGRSEYWAAPIEALRKGYGDCEDFAITEFDGLQFLGADPNRYRLMLVACKRNIKDVPGDIDHCVLAVDTSAANDWKTCLTFGESIQGQLSSETGDKPVYYLTKDSIGRIKEISADSLIALPKTPKAATRLAR